MTMAACESAQDGEENEQIIPASEVRKLMVEIWVETHQTFSLTQDFFHSLVCIQCTCNKYLVVAISEVGRPVARVMAILSTLSSNSSNSSNNNNNNKNNSLCQACFKTVKELVTFWRRFHLGIVQ